MANPNGKQLLQASLQLFRQDKQIAILPVLAVATSLLAFLVLTLPLEVAVLALVGVKSAPQWIYALAAFPGILASTFSAIFFNVAVVYAATDRIEGRTPTIKGSLKKAWTRKEIIFTWALVSAVVGGIIRAIERRAGILGQVLGFLGGIAWAIATLLVVPVIAFEDVGPFGAIERSSHLLKQRFGKIVRSELRFGLVFVLWYVLAAVAIVVAIVLTVAVSPFLGIPLFVAAILAVLGIAVYASVVQMYLRTILYRYATNQSVPDLGFDLAYTFNKNNPTVQYTRQAPPRVDISHLPPPTPLTPLRSTRTTEQAPAGPVVTSIPKMDAEPPKTPETTAPTGGFTPPTPMKEAPSGAFTPPSPYLEGEPDTLKDFPPPH